MGKSKKKAAGSGVEKEPVVLQSAAEAVTEERERIKELIADFSAHRKLIINNHLMTVKETTGQINDEDIIYCLNLMFRELNQLI